MRSYSFKKKLSKTAVLAVELVSDAVIEAVSDAVKEAVSTNSVFVSVVEVEELLEGSLLLKAEKEFTA